MLRSCICTSYDRQCVCLAEESAAVGAARFKGKPHPFPRQRAADCSRSPSTSYHVWTFIGNFNVPTSLDGGGLYALRAGRCGCDSLSLASSRQRVKSLRSSVRLRLVIHTARSILSTIDAGRAVAKSSEGSQESETVPSVHSVRSSLRHSSHRLAMRYPYRDIYVRTRYSPLRSVPSLRRDCPHSARTSLQRTDSAALHGFPRSHLSLPAKASFLSPCLQSHLPDPLQAAPLPLGHSPCVGGRTHTPKGGWHSTSIRCFVQAAESPLYPARTSFRPPPAAAYGLACSHLTRLCPLRSQRLARCRAQPH